MLKYIFLLLLSILSFTTEARIPSPGISGLHYSPNPVTVGQRQTFGFSYTNATKCYAGSVVYYEGPMTSGYYSWTSPVRTSPATWTVNVTCTNDSGRTASASVYNRIQNPSPPSASVYWSPNRVSYGGASTVRWSSSNASSCVLDGSSVGTSGSRTVYNNTSTKSASLNCSGPGGSSGTTYGVLHVDPLPKPTASLSWSSSSISYGGSSTLRWSSSNASSCVLNGSSVSTSGSRTEYNQTSNTTASLYCSGAGGTSSTTYATLSVAPPPSPSISSLRYSPNPAMVGDKQTFSFNYSNASKCYAKPSHRGNQNTSEIVYYQGDMKSGTYNWTSSTRTSPDNWSVTVTCTNASGRESEATVYNTINPLPTPTASLSWSPSRVNYRGSSTLSWSSSESTSCVLNGNTVATSGSIPHSNLTSSSTSSLYCTGPGGRSNTKQATVTVDPIPRATISSLQYSPNPVLVGNTQSFSFQYSNAARCYAPASYNGNQNTTDIHYVGNASSNDGNAGSGTYTWASPERTKSDSWNVTVRCENSSGSSEMTVSNRISYPQPTISNLEYSPSSILVGESQTFSFNYTNASKCYAPASYKGNRNTSHIYYVGSESSDPHSLSSSTYTWSSPVRTEADEWDVTVVCENPSGTSEMKVHNKVSHARPSISNLKYEPSIGVVGQPQTFSFNYTDSAKCYAKANHNGNVNTTDIFYVGTENTDNNNVSSGTYTWTSPIRTEADEWDVTVTCENGSGSAQMSVHNEIKRPAGISNLKYEPSTGIIGQTQTFSFDYTDAAKCYAKAGNSNNINETDIFYVGDKDSTDATASSGTYTWTSPVRTKVESFDVTVTCENSLGLQEANVVTDVKHPAPVVSNLRYEPSEVITGETQEFTFNYVNASKCYAKALHNGNKNTSDIYYVGDATSTDDDISSGTYTWTSPVRAEADEWSVTVTCENGDQTVEQTATTKITLVEPTMNNLAYSPVNGRVGQSQTFSFDYTNAAKCYAPAGYKTNRNENDIYYVGDSESSLDVVSSGTYDWVSPVRDTADAWEIYVRCENSLGSVELNVRNEVVLDKPTITNLRYTEGVTGQSQIFSFDYTNAAKCFAPSAYNGNQNTQQINYVGAENSNLSSVTSGTYTWTSPVRTELDEWDVTVRCINASGEAEASVNNVVELGVPVISDLQYTPNPAVVGQKQVFSFDFIGATKCYAPAASADNNNQNTEEIVYFQAEDNLPTTSSYEWTSPVRTEVTDWSVTVVCINGKGTGEPAVVSNVIKKGLDTPELTVEYQNPSNLLNNDYQASWTEVVGAVTYQLEASFDDGETWPEVVTTDKLSQEYKEPGPGLYIYRVKACDANGVCGLPSTQKSINIQIPMGQCAVE